MSKINKQINKTYQKENVSHSVQTRTSVNASKNHDIDGHKRFHLFYFIFVLYVCT